MAPEARDEIYLDESGSKDLTCEGGDFLLYASSL